MSGEALDEAVALYTELLGCFPKPCKPVEQAFLNGYRRCLMVLDPSFLPAVAGDFQREGGSADEQ